MFTGIVHCYNEALHLDACLTGLSFCDQIIVVDLGSSDGSRKIADRHGAEVYVHEWVPLPEKIRSESARYARHDWLIYLDPDEVFPSGIEEHLYATLRENPQAGAISVPWQFYFKGRPLYETIWGQPRRKRIVVHRTRTQQDSMWFAGMSVNDEYELIELPRLPATTLKHYWADSYRELIAKHLRYVQLEGEHRYARGERFSWRRLLKMTVQDVKLQLVDYQGMKGGFRGIFLSFFHVWFVWASILSLRQYQHQQSQIIEQP